ncbi:porin [Burkholderia sp. IMCC1007]|uniref:porin n=1 Tax=Burkholderia sp. IMCC1007 TaxID=3004104 RepID=UPI0022B3986C|nr:porin [Burkholderia sp. IMCC1007]
MRRLRYAHGGATLIASCISLFAHAQSSVTLFGVVDNGIGYTSNQKGHSNIQIRGGQLNADKFGLQGKEDIGGGTAVIFKLEQGYDINTGAQAVSGLAFNRQANVGITNDRYGTLSAGRQYTPYFFLLGPMAPAAYLSGSAAHPGDITNLDADFRVNNSVSYMSPTWSGFAFGAMYAFGGTPGSVSSGNTFDAAVKYANGPFSAGVGYHRMKNATGTTNAWAGTSSLPTSAINTGYVSADTVQIIGVAAQYSTGNVNVGANYANVQYRPNGSSSFTSTATFNVAGTYVNWLVRPDISLNAAYSYTAARAANNITDPARYHQISATELYLLSKRTAIYFVQSYQVATGKTLGSGGITNPISAVASVGDAQNGAPSSNGHQFLAILGIRSFF